MYVSVLLFCCISLILLHCALAAAQCIVIGPVCWFVCGCVCLWVCYHDNSKLRASIFTKLGLLVKVVTVSSWLNFGRPVPPGRGSAAGRKCLVPPYYSQRAVFASLWALFSLSLFPYAWLCVYLYCIVTMFAVFAKLFTGTSCDQHNIKQYHQHSFYGQFPEHL